MKGAGVCCCSVCDEFKDNSEHGRVELCVEEGFYGVGKSPRLQQFGGQVCTSE